MSREPVVLRRGTFAKHGRRLLFACIYFVFATQPASAQTSIFDAVTGNTDKSEAHSPATASGSHSLKDELRLIESSLAAAHTRQSALKDAYQTANTDQDDAQDPPESLEWAGRLVRVLEQRRETQLRSIALEMGREAIETALSRDPSEVVGEPPPFAVPTLDGVMVSWRDAVDREAQHSEVLTDRRGNLDLAKEVVSELEKNRRRIQDLFERADDELEQLRLERELRELDDELAVTREKLALAKQQLNYTQIEHQIKRSATHQALSARVWIETHLIPRAIDLADTVEELDHERFKLDREIDLARTHVLDAEGILRAVEGRGAGDSIESSLSRVDEITTRRRQLSHRQHLVAVLNQHIERLGRMRTTWQHRYAVLGDDLDVQKAPKWLALAEQELDRLTRDRRIKEAGLANLRLELATLLRGLADAKDQNSLDANWREREVEDLEALITFYQSDLESLEKSIQLEDQLVAELHGRLKSRDLGERLRSAASSLQRFWNFEITTSDDSPITPGKILIAFFVFAGGYTLARILTGWLGRRFYPRLGFDAGASNAFASLSFYGILAIVFLLALRAVNIPLTAFAVAGGALAIGVGFGSQTIIANFISGLLLLAERPIRTGDLIEVGGVVGSVESIGLRSTRIRTPDNFHIIVPNASFLESNVINWTHEDPLIRIRIAVGVAYGSPAREVERLLILAATDSVHCLSSPAPAVYFEDFAESALAFEVRFWIRYNSRSDRSKIRSDLRFRINELFEENGIVIAFPQIDVHLDQSAASSKTESDSQ